MKPQLAYNKDWSWKDIHFSPMYVSEKLDGIRCLITQDGPRTKQNKLIANKWIREELCKLPIGLDGELLTFTNGVQDDFHICNGKLRTIDLKHVEFHYYVFDLFHCYGVPYTQRVQKLFESMRSIKCVTFNVSALPQHLARDQSDVESLVKYWQSIKLNTFEGVMIRNPNALYKHGRCTLREQNIFKLVEWLRDEAMIVDFTPNTEHIDRIGAIKCSWRGQFIYLGSGFNHSLSLDMKTNPSHYLGRKVTFKYKKIDSLPRQPIFVGFYE